MNSIVPDVRCQKPSKLFWLEKGHLPFKTRKCLDIKVNMDTVLFGLAINQKASSAKQLPSDIWNGLFEPNDYRSLERRGPGRGCLNTILGTAKLDFTLFLFSISEARRCFHLVDVMSTESTMAEPHGCAIWVCYMNANYMNLYQSGKPCQQVDEGCQGRHAVETSKEKPGEAGDERAWTPEDGVSTTTARSVTPTTAIGSAALGLGCTAIACVVALHNSWYFEKEGWHVLSFL